MQVETVVDIEQLLANIEGLPQALVTALSGGMEVALEIVEADAAVRCPKVTTELSTSIQHEVIVDNAAVRGFCGSMSPHAPFVHDGTGLYAKDGTGRKDVPWVYCDDHGNFHTTSGQKPNPFLQDSIDANQGKILQCFEGVLGK